MYLLPLTADYLEPTLRLNRDVDLLRLIEVVADNHREANLVTLRQHARWIVIREKSLKRANVDSCRADLAVDVDPMASASKW